MFPALQSDGRCENAKRSEALTDGHKGPGVIILLLRRTRRKSNGREVEMMKEEKGKEI
jgi:hypothetical protein